MDTNSQEEDMDEWVILNGDSLALHYDIFNINMYMYMHQYTIWYTDSNKDVNRCFC